MTVRVRVRQVAADRRYFNVDMCRDIDNVSVHDRWPLTTGVAQGRYYCSILLWSQKTKQNNEKIHNTISQVSKGDCIIMGDFNRGHIKWDTLQSTGVEDSTFLCLVQDNFLTQHVLEPIRAALTEIIGRQRRNTRTIG